MTIGKGSCKRKVILNFLVIPCRNAFKGKPERSFIGRLDAMASPVHLKVTYHNIEERLVIVNADVDEAKRIKEIMHKDLLTLVVA